MATIDKPARIRRSREERERIVLDAAAELFYARGVHEVGMDEVVAATGLGKATLYRLYPTKDALIAAYLQRQSDAILGYIDDDIAARPDDPAGAVRAIFTAIEADVSSKGFRGCAFNNASIEFADPAHPARAVARDYRAALHERLTALAGPEVGAQLALVVDGMYTSAAHLGPHGPAAQGRGLVDRLLDQL